jgi:hypothetical protein
VRFKGGGFKRGLRLLRGRFFKKKVQKKCGGKKGNYND